MEEISMAEANNNDTVKVHYTGKLENGKVFDSSEDRDPLQFKIGDGQLIPGFEQAIVGMKAGESKSVQIAADQAYGPFREEMVVEVDRNQIPDNLNPEVGQQLQVRQPNGQNTVVTVTNISESKVTLDANHPLAGKDLIFEIKLIEIV